MEDVLDISEVVRRTGLTSRALRFYETRGLVKPLRTHSGRRLYGRAELERINQIVALKRAGLTLSQIESLITSKPPDLSRLIKAQLAALAARRSRIAEAIKLLSTVDQTMQHGEAVDVTTFCELIRQGDAIMASEEWNKAVVDHLVSDEEVRQRLGRMAAAFGSIDPKEYREKWADLSRRIEAALPLDPASAAAQAFFEEYLALAQPFRALAQEETGGEPASKVDIGEALSRMDEWRRQGSNSTSVDVFQFLFTMEERRKRAERSS